MSNTSQFPKCPKCKKSHSVIYHPNMEYAKVKNAIPAPAIAALSVLAGITGATITTTSAENSRNSFDIGLISVCGAIAGITTSCALCFATNKVIGTHKEYIYYCNNCRNSFSV